MKKIYQLTGLLLVATLLFSACKKDGNLTTIGAAQSGAISASASTLVLSKSMEPDTVMKITITPSGFGEGIAVNNILQFALKGTNFASPKEIVLDANVMKKSFTGLEFNALISSLGATLDAANNIEVRVKTEASGATSVAPIYTPVLALNITPYALVAYVYVPGDYQGWTPSTADSLKSATGNGIYTGVIDFGAKANGTLQFKITPLKKWDVAYGSAGTGKVSTTSGDNLMAPGAYQTKIVLNTNDNTITMDQYSFGIIGSATPTGWGADTNMLYNNSTGDWSVTLPLIPGEIKFRLNDDWGVNYGGKAGVLAKAGDNIVITEAATYKVVFNLDNSTYSVTKQ